MWPDTRSSSLEDLSDKRKRDGWGSRQISANEHAPGVSRELERGYSGLLKATSCSQGDEKCLLDAAAKQVKKRRGGIESLKYGGDTDETDSESDTDYSTR